MVERPPVTDWRVAVAGVSAIGVGYGFARYGYGLFLPQIRAEFGLSVSVVGTIGSATYLGYLVALTLVGALITRIGPRAMIMLGGLSATAGMALVAFATTPVLLIAGLVLAGTSSGWIWAPYSDAVRRLLPAGSRERALAIIPSGTAFAVVLAGPLALLARATGWRPAWVVFAAAALAATYYNAVLLRKGPAANASPIAPNARWFARRNAIPLYLTALTYGLLGSVYWTYTVEAIAGTRNPNVGPLFWTLMGLSGTAGVFTGRLIARAGLPRTHRALLASLATAVALIGIAPGTLAAVIASALLYGCTFMATSGLLAVWSYQVFPEHPATGFSATVFFLGLGSVIGPAAMGAIAAHHGLRATFLLTAALTLLTLLAHPNRYPPASRGQPAPSPAHTAE